ncbi:protein TIC 22, chloroplastic-like [Durio zibethinus]|uniref:Protein TIC 22, chloroplastic-like n=1 Tax=Durio zibethinus TaxID=66656 RepID=A0A6P5ZDJ2_DURZI|nr:protein TIC 22, chloroplastic-like [Durio zibethinus]
MHDPKRRLGKLNEEDHKNEIQFSIFMLGILETNKYMAYSRYFGWKRGGFMVNKETKARSNDAHFQIQLKHDRISNWAKTRKLEFPKPPPLPSYPLLSLYAFIHRLGAELATRLHHTNRLSSIFAIGFSPQATILHRPVFASVSQPTAAAAATSSLEHVAKTLAGTAVYTVSNSNNEFVLIYDPNGIKSIGFLCFRQEDAEAFLAQVRLRRRELRSNAKVVPITLDQSDLLVMRKKNKRFCPIYFNKEDIEKELSKVSRASRGTSASQHIMVSYVGSLEDVLKKMEMSEKNWGWDDVIFIPPGKSYSQHIQDVMKV